MKTDNERILNYTKNQWITAGEACWKGISCNLRSRIPELEKLGYKFDKRWLKLHNGKQMKEYRLSKDGRKLYYKHLEMLKKAA